MGMINYRRGQNDRAVANFREALQRDPKNPRYTYHLGLALAASGDRRAARTQLEAALALDAEAPEAAEARAVLARLQGSGAPR
jgi:Flp pilus assembly protein TadD